MKTKISLNNKPFRSLILTGKPEMDVVFLVSIYDDCDGYIIHKKGEDFDLLVDAGYISDCGLIIPEGIAEGIYECSNLIVMRYEESGNPDNPDVDYDLECTWKPLWKLEDYKKE